MGATRMNGQPVLTDHEFERFMALSARAERMGYGVSRNGGPCTPFVVRKVRGSWSRIECAMHDLDGVEDWLDD